MCHVTRFPLTWVWSGETVGMSPRRVCAPGGDGRLSEEGKSP